MSQVVILGAGSWGTALAVLWAPLHPCLWDHDTKRAEQLASSRLSQRFLPGITLPQEITIESDLARATRDAEVVVIATPSHAVRNVARALAALPHWQARTQVLNATKGLEEPTGMRMSQVLQKELPQEAGRIASLVGPSHAEEVARGVPTSVVVAGSDPQLLQQLQERFSTQTFRIYTNDDPIGVELAVSMKNVIAIAAGVCDGLGFGDNTKGALLTRGLAEMSRLGVALGARQETFAGLAGLGDLVTTAISQHSRNRNLGEALGKGKTLEQAYRALDQVVEGVHTTRAVLQLAHTNGIDMPITEQVHEILFANKNPRDAIRDLMLRAPKMEVQSSPKGAI